jgi:hypothetical protein
VGTELELRTSTGLTLQEAEVRIAAIEAAAAKAADILSVATKAQNNIDHLTDALLMCCDLLFDELRLEGMKHSEWVDNSLAKVRSAIAEYRKNAAVQKSGDGSRSTTKQYGTVLELLRVMTNSAADSAKQAAASAEASSLVARLLAGTAKNAILKGAMDVADAALVAARAATDAAAAASSAADNAHKTALLAAGHTGEVELLLKSSKAHEASKAAIATAAEAQKVFIDAYEDLQKARRSNL